MPERNLCQRNRHRTTELKAAVLLALLPAVLLPPGGNALLQAQQQQPPAQQSPPQTLPARLGPNTEVPLLVLKEMGTGRTPKGTNVILAVERDITDPRTGRLIIRKGTPALATVTWSQHDIFLKRRSARLNIQVKHTYTVDGQVVPLWAGNKRTFYGFKGSDRPITQEKPKPGPGPNEESVMRLWNDKKTQPILAAMVDTLVTGQSSPTLTDPKNRDAINQVAQGLGLADAKNFYDSGGIRDLQKMYDMIVAGQSLKSVASAVSNPTLTIFTAARAIQGVVGFGTKMLTVLGLRGVTGTKSKGDFTVQPGVRVPARTDAAVEMP